MADTCFVGTRDVKFGPTGTAPGRVPGPRRAFVGPNVRLPGSCRAQHERPNAKGIYFRARCNAGLHARPIQDMCGAGSVPGQDFGEILTSLIGTLVSTQKHDSHPRVMYLQWRRNDFQVGWAGAPPPKNYLPPNSSFSSDFGHFILKITMINKNIIIKYF